MKITNLIEGYDVSGLFHRNVGFPKNWVEMLPRGFSPFNVQLKYGPHSRQQMQNKYGVTDLPNSFSFKDEGVKLVELEIKSGQVVKLVARMPFDEVNDLVIAFHPHDGFVRTAWLNKKTDKHNTLDKSKYDVPVDKQ